MEEYIKYITSGVTGIMQSVTQMYPLFLMIGSIMISTITQNPEGIYLFFGLLLSIPTNSVLKNYVAKYIAQLYGRKDISGDIVGNFGRFERPIGAANCGVVPNNHLNDTSYGMPSGHSESAWFASTYIIMYIIDNYPKNSIYYISIASLLIIPMIVMYARVNISKCHTVEQTLVGALVGIVTGVLYYKLIHKMKLLHQS